MTEDTAHAVRKGHPFKRYNTPERTKLTDARTETRSRFNVVCAGEHLNGKNSNKITWNDVCALRFIGIWSLFIYDITIVLGSIFKCVICSQN